MYMYAEGVPKSMEGGRSENDVSLWSFCRFRDCVECSVCENRNGAEERKENKMKVLMINGSPNENGCTNTALEIIGKTLAEEQVDSEIFQIGRNCVKGCIGCGACSKEHRCIFDGGVVNEILDKMENSDGLIIGSPVYFASPSGTLVSALDRIFMAGDKFYLKPAAAIATARRAGMTPTVDVVNRYFACVGMPTVPGNYYNMIFGRTPQELLQDEEGVQTMRTLGRNMAWMLKCIEAGKNAGIDAPAAEKKIKMTFIRQA